jgi:transcriptional regulator with XRE-family HTH domain
VPLFIKPIAPERALENYAKNVQRLRVANEWDHSELARAVKASPQHIKTIERGDSAGSVQLLIKLSIALGATVDDLLADPPIEDESE